MPRTSRPLQIFPIVLRRAEVARVVDLTPNMRRITLAGDELLPGEMGAGYERPPFRSHGFDDHIKLVIPPADGALPRIGTQEEMRFAWNPEALAYTRDYTVRTWNSAANSFDVDVVRHDRGLAAAWAFRARPGDEVYFAGPKTCASFHAEADWHLLLGDETALPAIGRWLDEAPAGTRGHIIVEVPTAADRQEIPTAADVDIEWLVRGDLPAGSSPQLFDALKRTDIPTGRVYAWCGGEAMTVAPIRRYLRRDLGLPKEDVEVVGYWRRPKNASGSSEPVAEASKDDAERLVPSREEGENATDLLYEVHEMTELTPPIVTRVAVTLGIGMLIGSGVTTLDALSRETAVAPERLKPLLEAMTALGLVESDSSGYRNTARGGVLLEESSVDELSLDNPVNKEALALVDLVDVLRSGGPSQRLGQRDWRARRATDANLDSAYQDRNADSLQYVLGPLGQLGPVADAEVLAIFGDAAPVVAANVGKKTTVHLPENTTTPWPKHDCAILIAALEGHSDADALAILETAFASGSALVVAERLADKAASDDHVAERALTSLAVTGSPLRSSSDIEDLLRKAGASSVEKTVLGWGFGPFGTVLLAHV